ncbi:hypothetical protein LINPERPRIM_LOCUS13679, partial [Linum perenne]
VHDLYKIERVSQAYGYGVPALVGRQAWPRAEGYDVLPPKVRRMPGRPKKARQREAAELIGRPRRSGGGVQLSRRGMIMHCRNCKGEGHNSRNCPRSVPVSCDCFIAQPYVIQLLLSSTSQTLVLFVPGG